MARPMPRAPPLTIMFLGGAWKAMVVRVSLYGIGVWDFVGDLARRLYGLRAHMQVRTFDVISISEKSWGFCDNESKISKFGIKLRSFGSITSVGVRDYLLYYPSSPLEPFTALALARDANSSSASIQHLFTTDRTPTILQIGSS